MPLRGERRGDERLEPGIQCRRGDVRERGEQPFWVRFDDDHRPVIGGQKSFVGGVIEKGKQGIEIALYVQQAAGFGVEVELTPRQNFEEFV